MSLHHPGKVLSVHNTGSAKSADSSVQATLEMWDENVLTFTVDSRIAKGVKVGDTVLVDYTPTAVGKEAVQRQVVVKVLNKANAENVWKAYKGYFGKLKQAKTRAVTQAQNVAAQSAEYFG